MASSNRHWPSMFKSKPTTHQWHSSSTHDSNNLISSACHRSLYTSGCEERSPEPKPRWNPKPEQIRILESIFNSGMVNPPRDEIRKIRAQLQEYGQVGDANVFYWFQNRKSRSKHKTRHLQKPQNHHQSLPVSPASKLTTSSSSSSEKSSSKSIEFYLNSPTASVNQQPQHYNFNGYTQEPFYLTNMQQSQQPQQPQQTTNTNTNTFTQGFCFSELGNVISTNQDHNKTVGSGSGMLLTDLMMMTNQQNGIIKNNDKDNLNNNNKSVEGEKMMKMCSYNYNNNTTTTPSLAPTSTVHPNPATTTVTSTIHDIQGAGVDGPGHGKSTVFINDVAFEVAIGPFNVKEAFGDDAVLIHSYGQPVVTNEWGVTLQSLQHGAFYYLVRSFSYDHSSTIELI